MEILRRPFRIKKFLHKDQCNNLIDFLVKILITKFEFSRWKCTNLALSYAFCTMADRFFAGNISGCQQKCAFVDSNYQLNPIDCDDSISQSISHYACQKSKTIFVLKKIHETKNWFLFILKQLWLILFMVKSPTMIVSLFGFKCFFLKFD